VHGSTIIWAHRISNGISHGMDTEISTSHPESCRKRVLDETFSEGIGATPECEIIKINIQPDHIHVVMIIPPKYAVSTVVGKIKGMTSSLLRKKYDWLKNKYWKDNIVWSPGYFVSTIGVEEEKILKYVEYQGRQDSGQAKLEL
jgi:putative transposase